MLNPLPALTLLTGVILAIAGWAMVTQDGEDMEGEDFSYFESAKKDKEEKKEAARHRHAA